jgi:transcriptional regulator with XRE-family HTH domain
MKEHIYQVIVSQRRKLGISQQELAIRAGLRREKLNRLESKGENIGFDELCRLLDAAGLEFDVREKDRSARPSFSSADQSASADSARRLVPQDFHKASFIDGSKAQILDWGKLPR